MEIGACRKDQWFVRIEKVSMADSCTSVKIFKSENRTDYNSLSSKTLSNLNLL